ncbi:phosphoesterase [Xylella taiwanensis]|uniref:Phosphoesterase n=2 Tax=Xylella taiwanensis TaxID=1444770 RepID=Z9JHD1_9GAMM|nr:phosphoesterase [Xylella taiwanensis]AXI82880.1 phosphoesterase [Xylella taiwanensis]EWS77554.1 phosphoesterase [Xylella taiwanensis]MCD8458299.1 phosphoesterase [Xylella taiwanensis]MCD8460437.1 phosphoesterase [Xylella taiwanensis]MCD8463505.1 phosphoesterase [Xylella taiwanensis]
MNTRIMLARIISVLGHPGVLVPLAIATGLSNTPTSAHVKAIAIGTTLVLAVLGLAYSLWQVRRGHWSHVDAPNPDERAQLLPILLLLLGIAILSLWALDMPEPVIAGPVVGIVLVLAAHSVRHWIKPSLHVGFGMLAAGLNNKLPMVAIGLLTATALVGWSRLALGRHTGREVAVGAVLGAAAAALFHMMTE